LAFLRFSVTLHSNFILEVNLEKLFVVLSHLSTGIFGAPAATFIFATDHEEARQKTEEEMIQRFSTLTTEKPTWHIIQTIEVDNQLIIKAYNNYNHVNTGT
jgi:hypothetical protein